MDERLDQIEKHGRIFLIILGILCVFGITMVYSSSYIYAKETFGNSGYLFYKQFAYLFLGTGLAFIVSKTKLNFWLKFSWHISIILTFLLLLTFIPGLGVSIKGAHRWLALGPIRFQPGEFSKYAIVILSLNIFQHYKTWTQNQLLKQAAPIAVSLLLLLLQPDFGTFSICLVLIAAVCFLSDFPRKYLYSSVVVSILLVIPILLAKPYRVRRLFAFLDPWKNPQTSGFQVIQSYLAFASGSIFGEGLGNSNEKLFYLPEAHNDFVFSVIGEELGFFGIFCLVMAFVCLIFFGFKLAASLKFSITRILVATIVFAIGFQVILNMGVVLGLLPTKGLNLPFISAGGSSLVANFWAVGLMFSAVKKEKDDLYEKEELLENFSQDAQSNRQSYFARG